MPRHALATPLVLLGSGLLAAAPIPQDTPGVQDVPSAKDAFSRLQGMDGTWDADTTGDGRPDTVVTYEVIAAGSCVSETLFAGEPHQMVTMYHLDGPRFLCTHYCAAQNQPRMAATTITDDSIAFTFVDCTNLASPDALRMDSVLFTFNDDGTVSTEWGAKANGKEQDHVIFAMKRRPAAAPVPPPAAPSTPR